MSPREHSLAQPEGRERAKPGTKGEGDYFRIVVRSKDEFVTFRNQDIGEPGHIQRLAGKRSSGSWDTQAWLISKEDAHIEGNRLIPDTDDAREVIEKLGSEPKHIKADIFEAKDRPNVPESEKPTPAQQRARMENIEKAQQARRKSKQERIKNGQIINMTFTTVDQKTALSSGELASGGEVEGTVAFEELKDDSGLVLIYQANMFNENEVIKFNIK